MRVAALYDIHGNDAALAAVLAEIDALGVDLIVIGGDVAGGAFPRETIDAVRALGDRAVTIRGNGERELVEARLRLDAGTARIDPDDVWSSRTHWAAGLLEPGQLEWMRALPPLSSVEIDGLGDVLFCHALAAQRRGDHHAALARVARRSHARRRGAAHRRPRPHPRAVRPAGRRARGSSTPAAWACPTPARPPRTGRCSAPASSCAAPPTTSRRRPRADSRDRMPDADEFADGLARPPGAAEANEFFERMATAPKSV